VEGYWDVYRSHRTGAYQFYHRSLDRDRWDHQDRVCKIGLPWSKRNFASVPALWSGHLLFPTPSFFKRLEFSIKQRLPPLDLEKRGILTHVSNLLINFLVSGILETALSCKV